VARGRCRFDQLIQDNAAELRLHGTLQVVREKDMAVATGIDRRSHAPPGRYCALRQSGCWQ
jgi:hypothetical protein